MDSKVKPLSDVLLALHQKFGTNLTAAVKTYELAEKHEIRARVIQHLGYVLGKDTSVLEHQKLLASYFDEIFGDMICTIYFSFCGLDNPARIVLRRALELTAVTIAYWDEPAAFWGWNDNNEDISYSELEKKIGSNGYRKFLEIQGSNSHSEIPALLKDLRDQYSKLSNVVHPKPYNFETRISNKFEFSTTDLTSVLAMLEKVQVSLLKILLCRFNEFAPVLKTTFPNLDDLL